MSSKKDLQAKLIDIIERLPDDKELILGFDLNKLTTADSILSKEDKETLIKQIKSAKTTKQTLRRTLALLAGLVKVALLLR